MRQFGCKSFSLLFDDIATEMCAADKRAFSSFAHAQVAVTNAVYRHLGEPETFLFCPTGQARLKRKNMTCVYYVSNPSDHSRGEFQACVMPFYFTHEAVFFSH